MLFAIWLSCQTDMVLSGHPFQLNPMVFNYKKNRAWAEGLHIVMQIGLTMAGCIMFCFFIGLYLDKWLGTKGLFIIIFIVLGIIGGGVTVYRQILDLTKDSAEDQ